MRGRGGDTGYRSPPLVLICCIARPAITISLPHVSFSIYRLVLSRSSRTHVSIYTVCEYACVQIGYYVLLFVWVGVRILCTTFSALVFLVVCCGGYFVDFTVSSVRNNIAVGYWTQTKFHNKMFEERLIFNHDFVYDLTNTSKHLRFIE